MPSQPRSELEQSLLQLIDSKVISGYTLFHSSGSVVMQEGDDQIDSETLSAVSHNFDAPGASDEDQHAPSYMLPAGRHDADTQRELSHNGERLTVIRWTLCDLCAISSRRKVGIVAGRLPANLILVATFTRPQLPAHVVTNFAKVCDIVRS